MPPACLVLISVAMSGLVRMAYGPLGNHCTQVDCDNVKLFLFVLTALITSPPPFTAQEPVYFDLNTLDAVA
jgi:hypothetical protein